jgi:hypothetical protein
MTKRAYVEQRLAEINTAANKVEPSMSYWKTLRRAALAAERKSHADSRALSVITSALS